MSNRNVRTPIVSPRIRARPKSATTQAGIARLASAEPTTPEPTTPKPTTPKPTTPKPPSTSARFRQKVLPKIVRRSCGNPTFHMRNRGAENESLYQSENKRLIFVPSWVLKCKAIASRGFFLAPDSRFRKFKFQQQVPG
ncbi:MAG TPA: hypothetical protein VGD60_01220 [Candidatus Acidoferrales bacterium]